jgi:hypothetical protein
VKFRRKQVEVEAIRFTGEVGDLIAQGIAYRLPANPDPNFPVRIWVEASASWCLVEPGDYIIRALDHSGVFPCKPEIFDETYEPVPVDTDEEKAG